MPTINWLGRILARLGNRPVVPRLLCRSFYKGIDLASQMYNDEQTTPNNALNRWQKKAACWLASWHKHCPGMPISFENGLGRSAKGYRCMGTVRSDHPYLL